MNALREGTVGFMLQSHANHHLRDGNWVPADKFENSRAKRKLFTWIFCWDLKLNVSSTGPPLGFPPKHAYFICWPPPWRRPCGFAPYSPDLSPFLIFTVSSEPMYSPNVCVHVSPTAVTVGQPLKAQLVPYQTLPRQLQSSPSRTSSSISSHFIISSHFNIPGGKQALYEVLLMAQADISWDKPCRQRLSQTNVL